MSFTKSKLNLCGPRQDKAFISSHLTPNQHIHKTKKGVTGIPTVHYGGFSLIDICSKKAKNPFKFVVHAFQLSMINSFDRYLGALKVFQYQYCMPAF